MIAWCKKYIEWLETSPSGKEAGTSDKFVFPWGGKSPSLTFDSNHGTIFINQLAGLKLIVGDKAAAAKLTDGYFRGIFQKQVEANGDQVRSNIFFYSYLLDHVP